MGKEGGDALDFPFSIINADTIGQIDESFYGIYGVFEKSNEIDYQGHISNLVVLYSIEGSSVVGISTSFYYVNQQIANGFLTYSSTTRDVNLLESGSANDSDSIPFVDEITLDIGKRNITVFSFTINSFEGGQNYEIGRVSFYYHFDTNRDLELESAFLDELMVSIRVVRFST
jgi:hypothetical protein